MILSWMLYSLAVTFLLALAAWTLEGVVREQSRPVRGFWVIALLGCLGLPLLMALRASPPPPPAQVQAGEEMALSPAEPVLDWIGSPPARVRIPAEPARDMDLSPWLLGAWLIVSGGLTLALGGSLFALERRRREWTPQEVDGRLVWISTDTGPAVLGVVRSRIVLPQWILRVPEKDRAMILAHEEEHIRAGDPRLLRLVLLIAVALPWNLPLWWIWNRLRRAVEIDCDLRVLARGVDPREYSDVLVTVSERGAPRRVAVVALSESPSLLERRIRLMLTPRSKYWRARIAGAAALAALLVASACWIEEPAAPTPAPLTLWIAPGGFFIEDVMSEAISIQDLSARLRERLAATSNPEALNVRKYVGLSSSGYEIAKRAACEAGVRMIYYSSDLPPDGDPVQASSVGTRVEQPLTSPCTSYTPSAQVKSCIQNVEDRPWVDSIVGTPQVEPMREDWAQITGVAAVRQQGAESTRINWICDLYRDEAGEWQRRYLSFAPIE